jgi:hypothetical protein
LTRHLLLAPIAPGLPSPSAYVGMRWHAKHDTALPGGRSTARLCRPLPESLPDLALLT